MLDKIVQLISYVIECGARKYILLTNIEGYLCRVLSLTKPTREGPCSLADEVHQGIHTA